MKKSPVKKINTILKNSSLVQIVKRANELGELQQKMEQLLPPQFQGLYRIVNLDDNLLTVHVQNATVRQGFLLQQQHFIQLIQKDFPQISALEINIVPRR